MGPLNPGCNKKLACQHKIIELKLDVCNTAERLSLRGLKSPPKAFKQTKIGELEFQFLTLWNTYISLYSSNIIGKNADIIL
jgi:hypothetical protein